MNRIENFQKLTKLQRDLVCMGQLIQPKRVSVPYNKSGESDNDDDDDDDDRVKRIENFQKLTELQTEGFGQHGRQNMMLVLKCICTPKMVLEMWKRHISVVHCISIQMKKLNK